MKIEGKEPLVKMVNINKSFGAIQALKDINFEIYPGEIVGLVGDNGAGKSTLIRILSGMYAPTKGEVYFKGERIYSFSPIKARSLGIVAVHQGFGLVDSMSIARNIVMGIEPIKKIGFFRFLDLDEMRKITKKTLQVIDIRTKINPDSEVETLSGGERQSVKIGRALFYKAKVILLDEPVTGLSIRENSKVIESTKKLRSEGIGCVFITHDVHQVYEIADRIVVLDKGVNIGNFPKEATTSEEIVALIRKEVA